MRELVGLERERLDQCDRPGRQLLKSRPASRRRGALAALALALLPAACRPEAGAELADDPATTPPAGEADAPPSRYLYVWAGDADGPGSDFLAVIAAHPDSADYGRVVATRPVGLVGYAHHTEHVMPERGALFANSFRAGASFAFDLSDPTAPAIAASLTSAGPYSYPHSFERLPNGNVLATFQNRGEGNREPGGLVELDAEGRLARAGDAANSVDAAVRPYSLAVLPALDRVVSTTADMRSQHVARSVQIWRLSDLRLLHTMPLEHGPGGNEGYYSAEPRVLADGRTVGVITFTCGLHLIKGVATDSPSARLVHTFPFENPRECALPVLQGRFWVQTVATTHSLVSLDMSDPASPVRVDELTFGPGDEPHWISLEPGGDRIVVTGVGTMHGTVRLVRLDARTGALSPIEGFRGPGSVDPWVSFDRAAWPHGETGPARPHGAVFSRR
ncbi:MAG: hypothetical protein ACRELC_09020 [Gemmatimonadota bacterium]